VNGRRQNAAAQAAAKKEKRQAGKVVARRMEPWQTGNHALASCRYPPVEVEVQAVNAWQTNWQTSVGKATFGGVRSIVQRPASATTNRSRQRRCRGREAVGVQVHACRSVALFTAYSAWAVASRP